MGKSKKKKGQKSGDKAKQQRCVSCRSFVKDQSTRRGQACPECDRLFCNPCVYGDKRVPKFFTCPGVNCDGTPRCTDCAFKEHHEVHQEYYRRWAERDMTKEEWLFVDPTPITICMACGQTLCLPCSTGRANDPAGHNRCRMCQKAFCIPCEPTLVSFASLIQDNDFCCKSCRAGEAHGFDAHFQRVLKAEAEEASVCKLNEAKRHGEDNICVKTEDSKHVDEEIARCSEKDARSAAGKEKSLIDKEEKACQKKAQEEDVENQEEALRRNADKDDEDAARLTPRISSKARQFKTKQTTRHVCYGCLKVVKNRSELFACARCLCAYYCSTECQRDSWNGTAKFAPMKFGPNYMKFGPNYHVEQVPSGHKDWCLAPAKAEAKVLKFAEDLTEAIGGDLIYFSDNIYKAAVDIHDIHSIFLEMVRNEIATFREVCLHGFKDVTECRFLMYTPCYIFEQFFKGTKFETAEGKNCFMRFITDLGEECWNEPRLFDFITSHDEVWATLMNLLAEAITFHYRKHDPNTLEILKEKAPKLAIQSVQFSMFGLTLTMDSVANYVLSYHSKSTFDVLETIVAGTLGRKMHILSEDGEPSFRIAFTFLAILREQAKRLRGRKWADQHVPLHMLLSKLSVDSTQRRVAEEHYRIEARAFALAAMKSSGSIPSDSLGEKYMSWCRENRGSI